jgi:cation diffusion facilitator CzcD-associated flavoprotein CzcO
MYAFSSEELWKGWNYTERYPARDEILDYFKYVDQKWDLSKDIYFNSLVTSAEFDNSTLKWHVTTRGKGEGGQVFVAKFLVLCVGIAAAPYEGSFQGMEDFQGVVHHSSNWSREVDF